MQGISEMIVKKFKNNITDIIKLGEAIYSKIKKYPHSVIHLNILGISQKANLNY